MRRCIIIGGSPDHNPEFIKSRIQPKDFVICADGGYNIAIDNSIKSDWLIGDFDSVTKIVEEKVKKIVLPAEKDYTDTMYCVKFALREGFNDLIILGATGGRADHTYANYAVLKYVYSVGARAVLEDEKSTILYTEDELTLNCNGATVSILPFGCSKANVNLTGFKYGSDDVDVKSIDTVGVSNIANSETSVISVQEGGVLVFVSYK